MQTPITPRLFKIDLYPFKSLDGVTVPSADVLPSGALKHDRTFALADKSEKFVNAKRYASIHQVRSRFSDDMTEITVWTNDSTDPNTFHLLHDQEKLEAWFSQYFAQPVTLQQNLEQGFPDDTISPGPTVISTATLQAIAGWFDLSLSETRSRFRTNLEITGVPAFWEDQLFSESGEPVPFTIGDVMFEGINPCQRCVVPTREPQTGAATAGFQKQFSQQRAETLPETVARSRFNHFYRLSVNTRLSPASTSRSLKVGDAITLIKTEMH
ncbi:MOSC N-terminal beta barrel domain-containing protein [Oscillatoria sp. CS-180]|nr:MOSC N-terminal beta barrel domain-containing protein [Oscillatoria sp. CS-180]